MSSTFIEHSPKSEGDNSLILIMDKDGNVSTDPNHFEKIMSAGQLPEMGIKIVRLDASQGENEGENGVDDRAELKLTVEEICPENVTLNEPGNNAVSSSVETLPGTSAENVSHDPEPFLEMDHEQMERLVNALSSDQAKQMFGENVAAMFDMLNVDDNPANFLQNSIRNDHCYTNKLPSSDPNGPSFYVGDQRPPSMDFSKGKGKGAPIKGRKLVTGIGNITTVKMVNPVIVKQPPTKEIQPVQQQVIKVLKPVVASDIDYAISVALPQLKNQNEANDPTYEEDVDIEDMDSDASVDVEDDNLSDEDYNDRTKKGRRKSKKNKKKVIAAKKVQVPKLPTRPLPKPGSRLNRKSVQSEEIRARNEKLNDEMAKIVQSLEVDSKSDEDRVELKKGPAKVKTYNRKKSKEEKDKEKEKPPVQIPVESETPAKELQKQAEESTPVKVTKYPKRENRKPPAHLAEAFGPALFSTPDIIRRISTGEELPPTPSEKKNFTVGAQKNVTIVTTETNQPEKTQKSQHHKSKKPESLIKESVNSVKVVSKTPKITSLLKPLNVSTSENVKSDVMNVENVKKVDVPVVSPSVPVPEETDKSTIAKTPNPEIQKLIEEHHNNPQKTPVYDDDQDYSDENGVEDNYYLDPTQMDQSLLEGFGGPEIKSEEQLLQEAILLQEQYIGAQGDKNVEFTENPAKIEETLVETQEMVAESATGIEGEISGIYLNPQGKIVDGNNILNPSTMKIIGKSNPGSSEKRTNKTTGENPSEDDKKDADEDGKLLVVESRSEERRRNSAKRRRSDEVSDLDSDLDDALSEASWNSEDDPDRLWCICRKPHNNRFMICCDICEEWFHGKCVGISKSLGRQMDQDGIEWSCPNCSKKKKGEDGDREAEKIRLLKEKMAQSIRDQQQKLRENQKSKNPGGKDKISKVGKSRNPSDLKQTKISDYSAKQEDTGGRKCIMCKGPVRENSIYCSDDCIRKHSQHALSQLAVGDSSKKGIVSPTSATSQSSDIVKLVQKVKKEENRIVVMDPSSKKILVGSKAPTASNLATWLKENPSYQVLCEKSDKPGKIVVTSPKIVKIQSGETIKQLIQFPANAKLNLTQVEGTKSTQLKLAISPNSKQIKVLPSPGGSGLAKKQIFQIITPSGTGKPTPIIVKQKQAEVIDALPMPVKTLPVKTVKGKSQESTSPKAPQSSPKILQTSPKLQQVSPKGGTLVTKESPVRKEMEKAPRKRKERVSTSTGLKQVASKHEENKDKNPDNKVRDSVKKTLAETLKARVQECKEIEYNEENIDSLAVKIEERLFKHFENKTDTKYKSKYRSLIFNIKDPKNETLLRKIVDNSISPKELVKLSPEELANQELARWREKENQHQLEMIKKTELELMTIGNTYIMKSHKGEQVIESEQSEKVAVVAAEIDPNTPAQELVSALNSVSSTTQDTIEDEEKNKGDLETTLMKMKKKEKEKKRSRDRKRDKRDKDRRRSKSRSRSRSRSHRSKDKKRSRSRSRSRDRDRSRRRHKDKRSDKKKEKDTKDEFKAAEEKIEAKVDKAEISTSEIPDEARTAKVSITDDFDDAADHEPSSTVIIKTPDINVEEPESPPLWNGLIVMADVAKFRAVATEVSGDCTGLSTDVADKVDVVGRINFSTVWDYLAKMKKMGRTKDILIIKVIPETEDQKSSYDTLLNYLLKRSRIGVIKAVEPVKDFYLYPLASHSPLPSVLLPLDGPGLKENSENILLGIIVRKENRGRQQRLPSVENIPLPVSKPPKKLPSVAEEDLIVPESVPDRSYTPPLPEKEQDASTLNKKDPRLKRKIRVHVDVKEDNDEDDSPYSPGDSDDDLPPLPKIAKTSIPTVSAIAKLLSPTIPPGRESILPQDPIEIQKKIEEMNRAIEEETQQIQSLSIPLLGGGTSIQPALLPVAASLPHSIPLPLAQPTPAISEKTLLPLISTIDDDERYSPSRSFTPPPKAEDSIPLLKEVTSKISLPSNLQEILNSIQKTSEPSKDPIEDVLKIKPEPGSTQISKPENDSIPLLSRMSDEDIIRKAKEMEMEMEAQKTSVSPEIFPIIPNPITCPPQPLPPGVQDIPLIPINYPPPIQFPINQLPPPIGIPPKDEEDKKSDKKSKLDPKLIFESEGVTDFLANPSEDKKKVQKSKNFKIDIKLQMNVGGEGKSIDSDHFDIESISNVPPDMRGDVDERQLPTSSCNVGNSFGIKTLEQSKFDVDERVLPRTDETRRSHERDRRRSEDRKHDRRHYDEGRRYEEYRRFGKRDRSRRHERYDRERDRQREKEWEGDIKDFEEKQRKRNQEIRKEELRRLRSRTDSSSN